MIAAEYIGGVLIPKGLFELLGSVYVPAYNVGLPTPRPLYIPNTNDIANINANGFSIFLYLGKPGATAELNSLVVSGFDASRNPITINATSAAVPEPASLLLLGTGIAGMAARVRKRRKQRVHSRLVM